MPCIPVDLPGGAHAIVCTGKQRPKKCRWCQRPHTKLCDHHLGRGKTCDAPMCDEHAAHVANDLDLCPDHAGKPSFIQKGLFDEPASKVETK